MEEPDIDEKFYRIVYELDKDIDVNKHWLFDGKKQGYFCNREQFYKKYPNFKCDDKKKELGKIKYFLKSYADILKFQPFYDKKFFDYITNTNFESIVSDYNGSTDTDTILIDYDKKNQEHIGLIDKLKKSYKIVDINDSEIRICKYFINLKCNINLDYLDYFYKTNTLILTIETKSNIKYRNYLINFKKLSMVEKILKILEKNKTFDIVIPCYNTENYIHKTIKSVFAQTYKNFHIYLIDDKSTDRTNEILKEYEKYPNITVISNTINLGKYKSLNNTIEQLESDYYLVLDSDDVLTKNRLVYDLMAFAVDEKILLVQSKYFRYNEITDKIILEPNYGENIITFDRKIFGMVGKYYDTRFGGDTEFLERILKFLGDKVMYQLDKLTYIAIIRKDSSNLTKTIGKKDRIRFVRKYRQLHELNNVNFFINICK